MIWKLLKLVSIIISIIGVAWFAGGQSGFVMGFLMLAGGIALFIVCRVFEPSVVQVVEKE